MIPEEVSIGTIKGDRTFDDSIEGASTIRKIIISCNDSHLFGIQFQYRTEKLLFDGESTLKWNPLLYDIKSFLIDDDDVILEIFGSFDTEINQIGFITRKNHVFVCGKTKGDVFQLHFDGYTFSSVRGTLGNYLSTLTFKIVKIDELMFLEEKESIMKKQKKINDYKMHLAGTVLGADLPENPNKETYEHFVTYPKEFFEESKQKELEMKNLEA